MSNSDLDAVLARRHKLAEEFAKCEVTRATLLAEDQELGVTERVLARLSDFCRREPEIAPVADAYASQRMLDRTTKALRDLAETSLVRGREILGKIRAQVEKRP